MKQVNLFNLLCMFCCVACALFFSPAADVNAQENRSSRQYINGTVVGIGGRSAGRSRPFTLIVNGYTASNEVRELNDALQPGGQDGQDGLLRALSKMDAGRIQIGTGVGVPANVIIADPGGEGGTKLTVIYQRNLDVYELRYGTRSSDYRFGYAEIFLDRNGSGQGTFIPAARIRLRGGNTWEVEDFGIFPARLMGLRASGSVLAR